MSLYWVLFQTASPSPSADLKQALHQVITREESPAPKLVSIYLPQERERTLWRMAFLWEERNSFSSLSWMQKKIYLVCFKAMLHSCDCVIRGEEEPKSQPGQTH